ncbi:hypothetical protein ABPG75_011761 [Micractinium tetrahymenae]
MAPAGKAPAVPASGVLAAAPTVQPALCAQFRHTPKPSCERAARRPAPAVAAQRAVATGAAAAAAASGATLQAAQQQLEEPPSPSSLEVDAEYVFSVEGCCALRVHSRLSGADAQSAAALAAALVALRKREQGLNAAVQAARELLPGALESKLLYKFDRLRAAGRSDAAMAVLGPDELHELCSRVAPEACKEVEEALVAKAVQLQSLQLEPPPASALPFPLPSPLAGGSGAGSSGSPRPEEFRLRAFYDLPLDLTAQPEWEGWLRRLRGELIAWQQRQRRQRQQQAAAAAVPPAEAAQAPSAGVSPGGAAAGPGDASASAAAPPSAAPGSGPSAAAGVAASAAPGGGAKGAAQQPAGRGVVSATYSSVGLSPDGLGMRTELVIRVQPPQGRRLLRAIERSGVGGLAACGFRLDPALLALDSTPEPLLQHALEVAAFGSVRLPLPSLAFACTIHDGGQQAGSSTAGGAAAGAAGASTPGQAGGSGGSGSSSSGAFQFGGDALDLYTVLSCVDFVASGGIDGMSPPHDSVWVPKESRIRFQRRSGSAGGWRLPWGQPPPAAAAAGEASYRLQVQPAGAAAGVQQAQQPQQPQQDEQPAEVELSQRQLDALMDCLDAFVLQHPGYAGAPPLPPLASPPTLAQRAAEWVHDQLGGGGSSQAAADGKASS